MIPSVAISMGDPLGIGPEVVALALCELDVRARLDAVVFGDKATLERAAKLRGVPFGARVVQVGSLTQTPTPAEAGAAALSYVERASRAVIAREVKALCTAPLSKERVAISAPGFVGHTEHLSKSTGARVAMMLAGPRLRVVLVTTHLALAEVPARLSTEQIVFVTRLASRELRERWGIAAPRIAVCGLNPHAGEGGLLGYEERDLIDPALTHLRAEFPGLSTCQPGDTLFARALRGEFDVVVALYHDQGLAPLKVIDFDESVNVTLGLPFIRTSPDHGTAFGIAGQGKASPRSFANAVGVARRLIKSRAGH